jgi:hypothetical protein
MIHLNSFPQVTNVGEKNYFILASMFLQYRTVHLSKTPVEDGGLEMDFTL